MKSFWHNEEMKKAYGFLDGYSTDQALIKIMRYPKSAKVIGAAIMMLEKYNCEEEPSSMNLDDWQADVTDVMFREILDADKLKNSENKEDL